MGHFLILIFFPATFHFMITHFSGSSGCDGLQINSETPKKSFNVTAVISQARGKNTSTCLSNVPLTVKGENAIITLKTCSVFLAWKQLSIKIQLAVHFKSRSSALFLLKVYGLYKHYFASWLKFSSCHLLFNQSVVSRRWTASFQMKSITSYAVTRGAPRIKHHVFRLTRSCPWFDGKKINHCGMMTLKNSHNGPTCFALIDVFHDKVFHRHRFLIWAMSRSR